MRIFLEHGDIVLRKATNGIMFMAVGDGEDDSYLNKVETDVLEGKDPREFWTTLTKALKGWYNDSPQTWSSAGSVFVNCQAAKPGEIIEIPDSD